jgi:hypothetical protein
VMRNKKSLESLTKRTEKYSKGGISLVNAPRIAIIKTAFSNCTSSLFGE